MKQLILILYLLVFAINANSQNDLSEPEIIIKNNIKSVSINNCLTNSFCFSDYYEFGRCGKVILNRPGVVASYWKYEYDGNCKEKVVYSMSDGHGPKNIWMKTEYVYNGDKAHFEVSTEYDNQGLALHTDTVISKPIGNNLANRNEVKNDKGQIVQHDYGELRYPCAIIYEGAHIVKYQYHENGLIMKVKIYNDKGEVEVDLDYEYEKR